MRGTHRVWKTSQETNSSSKFPLRFEITQPFVLCFLPLMALHPHRCVRPPEGKAWSGESKPSFTKPFQTDQPV